MFYSMCFLPWYSAASWFKKMGRGEVAGGCNFQTDEIFGAQKV